jgi:S-adenosyl-L-methionine hydrolase (adenosine-forming)
MYDTITFLSDFGLKDDFVGVCKGVIKRIAHDVEIVDITHGIPAQAVTEGALVLARAVPYMPPGVHLAVVDPGVGSDRRGVAIRTTDGRVYVGPDNGLLSLAAPASAVEAVRSLTNTRYHLERVSRTFHSRDIFSPAAAHLASGVELGELGEEVDPATLVRIELPKAAAGLSGLRATVLTIDRFGNLELNLARADIDAAGLSPGDRVELLFPVHSYYAIVANAFADAKVGELILYEDSYGHWAIAINGGSAAALTETASGDEVRIRPV